MLLAVLGVSQARADETAGGPLELEVTASRALCTAGSVTDVSWTIRGGVAPYELAIDGQPVDSSASFARITCAAPADEGLAWLLGFDGSQLIVVSATDADGAIATASTRVALVGSLPPPVQIRLSSYPTWDGQPVVQAAWLRSPAARRVTSRMFLFRWREQGASVWTYEHAGDALPRGEYEATFTLDASQQGEVREFQIAHLRHALDREAPGHLIWSPLDTVTIASPPLDLTAEATHDSVTLAWGPDAPGLKYTATISVGDLRYAMAHEVGMRSVDTPPYTAHFGNLLPDTRYSVSVHLNSGYGATVRSFELRTEPAPEGASADDWKPRDIEAGFVDGQLQVTWSAPAQGSDLGYRVCVQPSGRGGAFGDCVEVGPGTHRARFSPRLLGGTYSVRVVHKSLPEAMAYRFQEVPSTAADTASGGEQAATPHVRLTGWPDPSYWEPWSNRLAEFVVFSESRPVGAIAEVDWIHDGERFVRQTTESRTFLYIATDESLPFRIRYLRDGVWTPWSETITPPIAAGQPRGVTLYEHSGNLAVEWDAPHAQGIEGYRLYISRAGADAQVVEVGPETEALVPIEADAAQYSVVVAGFNAEAGEGWRSEAATLRQGQPLTFGVWDRGFSCPAGIAAATMTADWSITGGSAPYTISFGDGPGFETTDRWGWHEVECGPDPEGEAPGRQVVEVRVVDSNGESRSQSFELRRQQIQDGEDPYALRLGLRSVHRTHVWLSWSCRHPAHTLALRWRPDDSGAWTYASGDNFNQSFYYDGLCRAKWSDLEPGMRHEFQLAHYGDAAQLDAPELLEWSASETVTTLGDPTDLSVTQDGEGVTVSWAKQPDAWGYQVVLRAEGTAWWRQYDPSGDDLERLVFRGLPAGAAFEAEIIAPPQSGGGDSIAPGFEYVYYGCGC